MKSNIWKFTVHKMTIMRMYMPILAIYLLTLDNTTTETVGTFLLVASIGSVFFEIPSGYISDKIGHKNALVLARISLLLSTIFFLIGASITWFMIGAVLLVTR